MTRYEQGFMSKCAEYGVDGRVMLKHAQSAGKLLGFGANAAKNFLRNGARGFSPAKILTRAAYTGKPQVLSRAKAVVGHADVLERQKRLVGEALSSFNPSVEAYLGRLRAGGLSGSMPNLSASQRKKLMSLFSADQKAGYAARNYRSFMRDPAKFLADNKGMASPGSILGKRMSALERTINGGYSGADISSDIFGRTVNNINDIPSWQRKLFGVLPK